MQFGLQNTLHTFQIALYIVLDSYKWKSFLVYLDYIIVFWKDADYHLQHVEEKLSALYQAIVTIKYKRLSYALKKLPGSYQRTRLTVNWISCTQETEKSEKAENPRAKRQLRYFLIICNVYRSFECY